MYRDAYIAMIKSDFDQFAETLVYTVGDNKWTDCHRPNNRSYNPLGGLAAIRRVFFPRPGYKLGLYSVPVQSQADQGIAEDFRWQRADVAFAAGVVPLSVVQAAPLAALAGGVLVAANVLAIIPAVLAARSRSARLLRAE